MDKANAPIYVVIAILIGLILYSLFGGEETFGEAVARLNQPQPIAQTEGVVPTKSEPTPAKEEPIAESNQPQKEIGKPVLLYFYGDYCSACRKFEPEWNKIVSRFGDRYRCVKVNSDDSKNDKLCIEFELRVIPTVYIVDTPYNVRQNLRIQSIGGTEGIYRALDEYLIKRERMR